MLPLILAGGGALIKGIAGAVQQRKANKIKENRPTYNIPDEILQNKAMYQNAANTTRVPGQSILENNLNASSAGSMNAAMQAGGSSQDILSAISGINQNQNSAINNLGVEGAQFQAMNKDKLAGANRELSEYKDQAFDYNQNQPYELRAARKRALQGAAYGNFDSALNDITGLGTAMVANGGGNNMKAAWGSRKSPTYN
jgi:hypothetical protein